MTDQVPEPNVPQQRKVISPRPVTIEEQLPAFNQFGSGLDECVDFEFFGSAANFKPVGQQILRHLKQKQQPPQ